MFIQISDCIYLQHGCRHVGYGGWIHPWPLLLYNYYTSTLFIKLIIEKRKIVIFFYKTPYPVKIPVYASDFQTR